MKTICSVVVFFATNAFCLAEPIAENDVVQFLNDMDKFLVARNFEGIRACFDDAAVITIPYATAAGLIQKSFTATEYMKVLEETYPRLSKSQISRDVSKKMETETKKPDTFVFDVLCISTNAEATARTERKTEEVVTVVRDSKNRLKIKSLVATMP